LDQARDIGEKLLAAVGAKEQGPALVAAQALQRQRNFTLFANAYDQVRRAISYLRWNEDDVDDIAPSLYAGRGTGRKKPESVQPAPTPAPNPAPTPAPAPVNGGANTPAPSPVASTHAPEANTAPSNSPFSHLS